MLVRPETLKGALEQRGSTTVAHNCRSPSISKNNTLSAALCRARYLLCASAKHPASTCSRLSTASPHSLQRVSSNGLVRVLYVVWTLVGSICSYNSIIPAMVWAGALGHSLSQPKHPCTFRSSSFHLLVKYFPCHFSPRILSSNCCLELCFR